MQYPEEFKQKVLLLLGDNEYIRKLLDRDPAYLAQRITDAIYGEFGGVSAQEIVEACDTNNYKSLYEKAKKQLELKALSRELWEIRSSRLREQRIQEYKNTGIHIK